MEAITLTKTKTAKLHSLIYSKIMPIFALLLLLSLTQAVHARDLLCGPEVRAEVAKKLSTVIDMSAAERLAVEAELYKEYDYCAQDAHLSLASELPVDDLIAVPFPHSHPKPNIHTAAARCGAKAKVFYRSSIYFEEMSCCGYDPQRRQFACPVKIKQKSGYGTPPLPGSRQYVKHCVVNPRTGKFVPVGVDSVHLANEMHGASPTWQFAVIANANENLQTIYPMSGKTQRARSILSWNFQPTKCDYKPIWGNVLEYNIRLDQ